MERVKRGIRLTRQSWQVIKADRSLLMFPVLSAIAIVVALIAIWAPAALIGVFADADSVDESDPVVIAFALVTAYVATFLTVFFNVGLASCASRSFGGEDTRVAEGISAAWDRVGQIALWALLATTVSVVLRALEERLPLAGRIAVWLVGVAWTIATYLVIPVLAHERVGPIEAVKRSGSIVKERWGESIVGNAGIGLVTGLAIFIVVLPIAAVVGASGQLAVAIPLIAIGAVVVALIAVVGSALTQVFNVAVYRFASAGEAATGPFSGDDLANAFKSK